MLALARETEILHKRVLAARGRVLCATAFLHHDKRRPCPTSRGTVAQGLRLQHNEPNIDNSANALRSATEEGSQEYFPCNSRHFSSFSKTGTENIDFPSDGSLEQRKLNEYEYTMNQYQSVLQSRKAVCDITQAHSVKKHSPTEHSLRSQSDERNSPRTYESHDLNYQSNKLCSEIVNYFNRAALQNEALVI